jgi:hypothetical protein
MGSLTFIGLSVIFPLLILLNTPSNGYGAWVGALAVTVLVGGRFAWIVGSRERRLFEMTTWLYFYLFLGAAPMVQLRERYDPGTTPGIKHELDWPAVAIVVVSALALMVGSGLANLRRHEIKAIRTTAVNRTRTTILTLVVMAFSLFYVVRLGPAMLLASRDDRARAAYAAFPDPTIAAVASATVSMGLLVAVVAQLAVLRDRVSLGQKRPFLLLTVSTIMLIACTNPISTPRYIFGTVALGLLAAIGFYGSTNRFRLAALGAIAGLLFVFPLLDVFRRTIDSTLAFESPFDSFLSGDYDSFAQINNTVLYVMNSGATAGQQALGVVFFWIPRSVWPDKPVDTGILLANERGYGFTNLSAPLPAEMFINGGWAVLVGGMLLFGFALRRWDAATERTIASIGVPSILGSTIPFYLLIVLRGSLLQAMAYLSVILVAAMWVRGSTERRPFDTGG